MQDTFKMCWLDQKALGANYIIQLHHWDDVSSNHVALRQK